MSTQRQVWVSISSNWGNVEEKAYITQDTSKFIKFSLILHLRNITEQIFSTKSLRLPSNFLNNTQYHTMINVNDSVRSQMIANISPELNRNTSDSNTSTSYSYIHQRQQQQRNKRMIWIQSLLRQDPTSSSQKIYQLERDIRHRVCFNQMKRIMTRTSNHIHVR